MDAFTSGASSLIHGAYVRQRQKLLDQQVRDQIAYQHQRDQLADTRYEQARQDRLSQQDREFGFKQAQAGYTPPTTELDTTPNATDISSGFQPNLPTSLQPNAPTGGGVGTDQSPIARAINARVPQSVAPVSADAAGSTPVGQPAQQEPAATTSSPRQLVSPGDSRLRTVPGHFDPLNSAAARTKRALADQTTKTRADAYQAAGLTQEDAAAAAVNPSLATKMLAPHGKKVYFNADGSPVVVDAQDPQFPTGFKKAPPASRSINPRDPNISASIATDRAIKETNQAKTATFKALQKPAAFSTNPQADSGSVVSANTPLLSKAGDLAVRADSLRRAYDKQASAIGTGKAVRASVDVAPQRQELDRRQQQMQAIVSNPKAPLAVKARAQDLFRQYIESIESRGGTP